MLKVYFLVFGGWDGRMDCRPFLASFFLFFLSSLFKKAFLENIVYHFFRQLWLVLGVKLMEINSNLFSRFIQLAENWLILSNPNVHSCFELILAETTTTNSVRIDTKHRGLDGIGRAQRLHHWNLTPGIYPSSNHPMVSGGKWWAFLRWPAWRPQKGGRERFSQKSLQQTSKPQIASVKPWPFWDGEWVKTWPEFSKAVLSDQTQLTWGSSQVTFIESPNVHDFLGWKKKSQDLNPLCFFSYTLED